MTVVYRLAPEHPHPAAIDDAVAAYRGLLDSGVATSAIAIAGESAGAGLAAATLVAPKHVGLPQPSVAMLMSPWADLSLSGESISRKAAVDPALTPEGLRRRAVDYVAAGDRTAELVSPIFADLTGLPPLLIQTGSHEILLNEATTLAARAAAADAASGSKSPPASHTCSKSSPRCSTKPTLPRPARASFCARTSLVHVHESLGPSPRALGRTKPPAGSFRHAERQRAEAAAPRPSKVRTGRRRAHPHPPRTPRPHRGRTSRPAAISASKPPRSSATISKIALFRGIKGPSPRPAKDSARGPNDNMTITIMSSATPPEKIRHHSAWSPAAPAVTTQRLAQHAVTKATAALSRARRLPSVLH